MNICFISSSLCASMCYTQLYDDRDNNNNRKIFDRTCKNNVLIWASRITCTKREFRKSAYWLSQTKSVWWYKRTNKAQIYRTSSIFLPFFVFFLFLLLLFYLTSVNFFLFQKKRTKKNYFQPSFLQKHQ